MLTEDIRDRRAWRRSDLSQRDWLVPVPRRCLDELPDHAELARLFPMDFSLPHARERLKGTATDGPTQDHASAR